MFGAKGIYKYDVQELQNMHTQNSKRESFGRFMFSILGTQK